jgi:hypothetical protein
MYFGVGNPVLFGCRPKKRPVRGLDAVAYVQLFPDRAYTHDSVREFNVIRA